ncbi:MAG TPA: hypothetical protein VGL01_05845 [Trinickia sp.]
MVDPQFCVLANSALSGVVVTKAPGAGVVDRIGRLTRPAGRRWDVPAGLTISVALRCLSFPTIRRG